MCKGWRDIAVRYGWNHDASQFNSTWWIFTEQLFHYGWDFFFFSSSGPVGFNICFQNKCTRLSQQIKIQSNASSSSSSLVIGIIYLIESIKLIQHFILSIQNSTKID